MPLKRNRSPFITSDIRKMMLARDNLARKAKKHGLSEKEWDELKRWRRRVTSNIRRQTKIKGTAAMTSNNHREAWKFIRQITFTTKNREKTDNIDLEGINSHFAGIVSAPDGVRTHSVTSCSTNLCFTVQRLKVPEVRKILAKTRSNTATGHDGLPARLIKELADSFAPAVTTLFNRCIDEGCFPDKWKKANVVPVWKRKGNKKDPVNYRPVSVLPVLARVLEKIIASQLTEYCYERQFIPREQFGFRRNSSCETALLVATNQWMREVDAGNLVGALMIDLSKAFDTW